MSHDAEIHALRNAVQVLLSGYNVLLSDLEDQPDAVAWIKRVQKRAMECVAEADAARLEMPSTGKMSESPSQDSSYPLES